MSSPSRRSLFATLFFLIATTGIAAAQQMAPERLESLSYRHIGPVGNRVSSVAGVPGDRMTYFAGAASGGIWKTADGGLNWEPVFDDQPVHSIGSIAVASSDPNVVWAGTGESFIRSNVSIGNGVWKSTDAGAREFSSDARGEKNILPEEATMRAFRLEVVGTPKLPKSAGMHRFLWDLRYAGPWHEETDHSGRDGPLVAPGIYHARVTTQDWSEEVSFEVKMDPRVVREGQVSEEDVRVQVELALKVRDALSDARLAAADLEKAIEEASEDEKEALGAIKDELVTAGRRYTQPMLIDQLSYLYGNLQRADQSPGRDAVSRWEKLNEELQAELGKLEHALGTTD